MFKRIARILKGLREFALDLLFPEPGRDNTPFLDYFTDRKEP